MSRNKFFVLGLFCMLTMGLINSAMAGPGAKLDPDTNSAWGFSTGNVASGGAGDFILAGCLNRECTHGTYDDEWAVVGMVADQVVEHGGYFCPLQIQSRNRRKHLSTWINMVRPDGYSESKCAWLCETNYSGPGCLPASSLSAPCDKKPMNTKIGGLLGQGRKNRGKFAGIAMKESGNDGGMFWEYPAFDWTEVDGHQRITILGIVKYMEHGVIAAPVEIQTGSCCKKGVDSYITAVGTRGTEKVLCATGYKPDGADCVEINPGYCDIQDKPFCENFDKSGYDGEIHTVKYDAKKDTCVKYFCSDTTKAFASATDKSCVDCSATVKGGVNPITGMCEQCQTGQYYDNNEKDPGCKTAQAYVKNDLQYGKGKNRNTNTALNNQCWNLDFLDEYAKCVKNGGRE